MLRSYKLNDQSPQGPKAEAAKVAEGAHVWPLESACQVNGTFQNLKQRKVSERASERGREGEREGNRKSKTRTRRRGRGGGGWW